MATEHLTKMFDDMAEAGVWRTPPGMAHWAGTGPANKTCRQCEHWCFEGYKLTNGALKLGACGKYRELTLRAGRRISHDLPACKYFDERQDPPPLRAPQSGLYAP